MGLFDQIVNSTKNSKAPTPAGPAAPSGQAPTRKSIIQSRSNFGVNLGSLFVQERFIYHRFFEGTPGDVITEYDAIKSYKDRHGVDKTAGDLEDHYRNFVNDNDWNWLKSKGVTLVRIPVGYWHVNNGAFASGTPFQDVSQVYRNAWNIFKQIVDKANQFDIGVLVDLHSLPGGANTGEHNGVKLDAPNFWNELDKNEPLALQILDFISKDLKDKGNIAGIQVVNESVFDKDAPKQKIYYTDAINQIRRNDSSVPVYISDGWWTDQWVKWINEQERSLNSQSIGVVLDVHIYRAFSNEDKNKSPEDIIAALDHDVLTNLSGSADIIVGEYSHVLDEQSWSKKKHDRNELIRNYGHKQSQLFQQRSNTGSAFWTLKFQSGNGGEWDFTNQVGNGNLPTRNTGAKRIPNESDFNNASNHELNSHTSYWDSQNKNEKYEHWRYKEGFTTGWSDAIEFGKFNGSKIGRLNSWTNSRRSEHVKNRGDSKFLWEWEQGFAKGIERAQQSLFN